ncbi:MAG: hypothetical protein A2173_04445 [Planctomycetes bacterium RBG_13_44_8b]|nr:MAG: hypothetical protein A2173_04445 [Planctomycetes bacterium RBG_13_44_8b]
MSCVAFACLRRCGISEPFNGIAYRIVRIHVMHTANMCGFKLPIADFLISISLLLKEIFAKII